MATENKVYLGVNLPESLTDQIERMATAENKKAEDVVREAVERHMLIKRHQALQKYGQANAKENGFTEADVPRLIAESRADASKRER